MPETVTRLPAWGEAPETLYWTFEMVSEAPTVEPEKVIGFVFVVGSSVIRLKTAECETPVTALPGVADLHAATLRWHRDRFAALVKTQAGYDLYGQLLHAYDSAVLPPELQRMLLLMFANVADADQTTQ